MAGESHIVIKALRAFGDPTRWRLLHEIAGYPWLPRKVLEDLEVCSPTMLSYHCRILQEAQLLTVGRRGREAFYSLRQDTVALVGDHVDPLTGIGRAGHTRL